MSIFYKLYQNKRKGSVTKDKWYARSAVMGKTVSLEDLAEHMAQHNTPYSEGVIKGVLTVSAPPLPTLPRTSPLPPT